MALNPFLKLTLAALSAALVATASAAEVALPGLANRWVLVIRHAEKPTSGTGLTPAGEARAKAYVKYFTHFKVDGKSVSIGELFATKDSKNSQRETLTLLPLSQATKLPLDSKFKNKEFGDLVSVLGAKPQKGNVLICWHHGNIAPMLGEFGADPVKLLPGGEWPDDCFDRVVELHFDKAGKLIAKDAKTILEPKF